MLRKMMVAFMVLGTLGMHLACKSPDSDLVGDWKKKEGISHGTIWLNADHTVRIDSPAQRIIDKQISENQTPSEWQTKAEWRTDGDFVEVRFFNVSHQETIGTLRFTRDPHDPNSLTFASSTLSDFVWENESLVRVTNP